MKQKKTFEVAMLGGALVMSVAAFDAMAATACSNGTGQSIAGGTTANFAKVGFTAKCSANVTANYVETANEIAVQGASAKGKITWGAGSSGGQVTACATAAAGAAPTVADPSGAAGPGC